MFWEIIEKNKRKSIIALIAAGVWYVCIYGSICSFFIFSVIDKDVSEQTIYTIFAAGIIISLLVFAAGFVSQKNKPYKIEGRRLYRINKKTNQELYNIAEETALASGIGRIPAVYILDSKILNAYACGISPEQSSIVVSKGLLELLSRDELQGVIAHEMSHIINRDTMYLLCSGILLSISAGFTQAFMSSARRGGKGASGAAFIALISFIGQSICFILMMFVSRKREYLADACAAVYTRNPKGLADALLKIENAASRSNYLYDDFDENNANQLIKASFIVPVKNNNDSWKSTHPLTENRIKILLNMTSADFSAYEKEFQKLNNKSIIPKSALERAEVSASYNSRPGINFRDAKTLKTLSPALSKGEGEQLNPVCSRVQGDSFIVSACSLDTAAASADIKTLKENKELLKENIKKHRHIEDMVRDLAEYTVINCECGTKLKIPPVYKNQLIICPHCGKLFQDSGKKHKLQAG